MRSIKELQDEINSFGMIGIVAFLIAVTFFILKLNVAGFIASLILLIILKLIERTLNEKLITITYNEIDNNLSYIIEKLKRK